jgi:hypothetical protein
MTNPNQTRQMLDNAIIDVNQSGVIRLPSTASKVQPILQGSFCSVT